MALDAKTARMRPASTADLDPLTEIWFNGWRDAHLAIVPAELIRLRTYANFRERFQDAISATR
jgi:hypothetical protein